MRFLANENFPLASVSRLRQAGHDVAAVIEDTPGAKDVEILTRAIHEARIVLTFDRDYGKLVYRLGLPAPVSQPRALMSSQSFWRSYEFP